MIKNRNIDPAADIAVTKLALPNGYTIIGDADGNASAVAAGSVVALADGKILVGDAAGDAQAVTPTGDVTIDNTGVTAVGAGKITNAMVAPAALDGTVAKVIAAENVIGGLPVLHVVDVGDVATGDTTVVLTHKTRITDVWAVKQAAAGDSASNLLTVKNVSTAITNAMDMNVADKTVVRCGTIDDAQWDVAAGANLVLSHVKAGSNSPAYTCFLLGYRIA